MKAGLALKVGAPLVLAGVLLAIAAAGYWFKRPAVAVAVACTQPLQGCMFSHRGLPARLRFAAPPVTMQPFGVEVRAPGSRRVSAEFRMMGMDMGFTRYTLNATGDGQFAASVTLPVCVSGQRSWQVVLDIDGQRYAIPFSTR